MQLFYSQSVTGTTVLLDEEESRHAIAVLRKRVRDEIFITDGKGRLFKCCITETGKQSCQAEIIEVIEEQHTELALHMAVAPTKSNERYDWFLEKGTEMGVTRFTPLLCSRSERTVFKTARARKILVAAMKQSGRLFLPELAEPVPFPAFIAQPHQGFKAIACMEATELLKQAYTQGKTATLAIGPEGDFTDSEVALAASNGFRKVSLGNRRLRTETAALAACMTVQLQNTR